MKLRPGSLNPPGPSLSIPSAAVLTRSSAPSGLQRLRSLSPREIKRRLARLNHVLVPAKKVERDRLRQRRSVKLLGASFSALQALTREGRWLLVLMFPVGLAALDVRFSQVHLLFALLWGLLVSAWLVRPLYHVNSLSADVDNPRRVAVDEELNFEVQLINRGRRPLYNLRILPPFLPWDGRWTLVPGGLPELLPGQNNRVVARARFQARGEHHLDHFEAGRLVLGGLAVGRTIPSPGARFLVVPRVANVVDVSLSASRGDGRGAFATSLQPGETDIAGVRPYRVGDELKHVHARTWARTGVPHVRHYLDECQDAVALAVITGGPDASELVKEATLSLAAGVAARLACHHSGIDTLVCDEGAVRITPRAGLAALDSVLDQLAVFELSSQRPHLAPITEVFSKASAVVVVSAEDTPELASLVERTRARGVPCAAAVVVESNAGSKHTRLPTVRLDGIEQGRAIRL